MLLSAPPPTPYDLRFSLLGIPVRVSPWFWLASALMGSGLKDPKLTLIWVAVVFVSILVHEFGHALTIRAFGAYPLVVLYHFGGLAITTGQRRISPQRELLILLAGPGAGLLLGGLTMLGIKLAHHQVAVIFGGPTLIFPAFEQFDNFYLNNTLYFLLQVNIWWSLVNLLPIYPLDGGQACYQVLTMNRAPEALVVTLKVSIVAAIAVALYGAAVLKDYYLAFFFAYLAYQSFATLQAYTGRGGGYGRW